MLALFALLSAASDSAPSIQGTFLQQGILGAVALAGGLFAYVTVKRGWAREDALEKRLHDLEDSVRTEFVPALTRATDALIRFSNETRRP
jgi:hypothetical protein